MAEDELSVELLRKHVPAPEVRRAEEAMAACEVGSDVDGYLAAAARRDEALATVAREEEEASRAQQARLEAEAAVEVPNPNPNINPSPRPSSAYSKLMWWR